MCLLTTLKSYRQSLPIVLCSVFMKILETIVRPVGSSSHFGRRTKMSENANNARRLALVDEVEEWVDGYLVASLIKFGCHVYHLPVPFNSPAYSNLLPDCNAIDLVD